MIDSATLPARLRDAFEHLHSKLDLGVELAYLFGSHAENRAHRESDIDVGVLLSWKRYPERLARSEARVTLISELIGLLHHNEVDVVILNDAPPLFARRIARDGILVHCRNTEQEHIYRRDVQLRAADIEPWLQRMRRIKLEALRR